MTPLFACIPVCLFFVALGLIALVVVGTGLANSDPPGGQDQTPSTARTLEGPMGPPPWWVIVLMALGLVVNLLVLAWFNESW